eukprot:scaffold1509_cov240-Pinguiococcus_pyrenoidosus.AAC.8
MFCTNSLRLASAQQAMRDVWTLASLMAATSGSSPPLRQMSPLFCSAKLRVQSAGRTSLWISGWRVRLRYNTGSRPPSSVTCLRTSAFCATLASAYAAYWRTSGSGALDSEISSGSMPSRTK